MTSQQALAPGRIVSQIWPVKTIPAPDGQALRKNIILMPGSWALFDPFLMMAEDWMVEGNEEGGGFELHPHRGFETVTNILEGELEHRDTKGGHGLLKAGDVQWTTTGRGVMHSEMPRGAQVTRATQLWLNLPKSHKFVEPRYQDITRESMPAIHSPDGRATAHVFSGSLNGVTSPTLNYAKVTAFDASILAGGEMVVQIPKAYNAFAYVIGGSGALAGSSVENGEVALLPPSGGDADETDKIELAHKGADNEAFRVLFFSGLPLKEAVVQRGPFVMNTVEEIYQAFQDFQLGRLA